MQRYQQNDKKPMHTSGMNSTYTAGMNNGLRNQQRNNNMNYNKESGSYNNNK